MKRAWIMLVGLFVTRPLLLAEEPAPVRGLALYARHCAVCHGETGRGDGPGASLNRPRPRDFATGQFRLVSTTSGVPSRADLFATLTRGIPGTGMPPWNHLPEADRNALVDAVFHLTREAYARRLVEASREEDPDEVMPLDEARRIAAEKLVPGEPIPTGAVPPQTPESAAQGHEIFGRNCANCHGEDGRGKSDPSWRTAEGEPVASRDLTAATLKGADDPESLYRRIHAGIPGTPMPANDTLTPEQIWNVVHYIRSIRTGVPEEARIPTWWLPESANAQGREIDHDFHLTLAVTGVIGFLVISGLGLSLVRGILTRADPVAPPYRPGSRLVEAVWIAIPAAIVLVMVVNSWVVYRNLTRPLDGALRVKVKGKQFFWAFEYPELGIASTGAAAVPAGRPVHFEIDSDDVIHSFYLPHLKMKRDAIPGFTTHLWMQPIGNPGHYPILCNQFCGTDHAIMNATLEVLPAEAFDRWILLRKEAR